jgi:hypothetical protein
MVVTVEGKQITLDHVAEVRRAGNRIGKRGYRYTASYQGETIVEASIVPEFAACRALQARGLHGKIGFRKDGMIGIVVDIDVGAKLTVNESSTGGSPRFGRWHPFMLDVA